MIEGPEAPLWPRALPERPLDALGVGQSSLDHVCVVDALPALGGKLEIDAYETRPGGQVATSILCAARLGLRTGFVGTLGGDAAAEQVLAPLRAAGVDLSGVVHVTGHATRLAVILVDRASGERLVLWHRDPALALGPESLSRERIEAARVLLLDAQDPEAAAWAAGVAREAGIPVVLDADAPWESHGVLLARVDFPIVSRGLAETLSGTGSVRDGLKAVSSFGARMAVVTLGQDGALAATASGAFGSPAFRLRARDTTGAGDAFHGAFARALVAGAKAREALGFANAVAGCNCEAIGAQGGLPTLEQAEAFRAERTLRAWREPDASEEGQWGRST